MKYNFKDCIRKNTFNGVQFQLLVNGSPKNLSGTRINVNLDGSVHFSTDNGKIIISDVANAKFYIPKQIISLAPKLYNLQMVFYFADGDVKTYLEGTWRILP